MQRRPPRCHVQDLHRLQLPDPGDNAIAASLSGPLKCRRRDDARRRFLEPVPVPSMPLDKTGHRPNHSSAANVDSIDARFDFGRTLSGRRRRDGTSASSGSSEPPRRSQHRSGATRCRRLFFSLSCRSSLEDPFRRDLQRRSRAASTRRRPPSPTRDPSRSATPATAAPTTGASRLPAELIGHWPRTSERVGLHRRRTLCQAEQLYKADQRSSTRADLKSPHRVDILRHPNYTLTSIALPTTEARPMTRPQLDSRPRPPPPASRRRLSTSTQRSAPIQTQLGPVNPPKGARSTSQRLRPRANHGQSPHSAAEQQLT